MLDCTARCRGAQGGILKSGGGRRSMPLSLDYWPQVCAFFGVAAKDEQAFERDASLSRSDAEYYQAAYFAKRGRGDAIRHKRYALEDQVARRDSSDGRSSVARAQERKATLEQVAVYASEYRTVEALADGDWQRWHAAFKAARAIHAYYNQAVQCLLLATTCGKYTATEARLVVHGEHPAAAAAREMCERRGSTPTRGRLAGPSAPPRYTGPSPESRRLHEADHARLVPSAPPRYAGPPPGSRRLHEAEHARVTAMLATPAS